MAPSREIEKLQRRWQENPLGLTFAPLAEAYRKEGMCADALELLEIGLAQHPSYVPAHIVRGRCFLDIKSESAAEQAFARVAELDPENVIALKGLADIAERAGRYSDAMAHLERLLAFDRANEEARYQFDRLRAHQHIPMTGGVEVVPEDVPVVAPDESPSEPLPPALALQSITAPEGTWAQPAVSEPAIEPEPIPTAEPAPVVELPKAEIVDADQAALEIEVYHPLELTAGPTNEYQSATDADALEPGVASGRTDFDDAAAHWPESAEPVPDEDRALHLASPPGVEAIDERAGEVVAGGPGGPDTDAPEPLLPDAAPDAPADETVVAAAERGMPATEPRDWSEAEIVAELTVEATEPGPADELETTAEPEIEADPELVVTETMAEIFLRQGHRQLALAVYTQLLERDSTNDRIRAALEMLQEEFRPAVPSTLPAFAAVLTGGQSVRGYFEQLLSARRPGPTAPDPSISLGEVFGDELRPGGKTVGNQPDPSFDEFFDDGGSEALPAAREPEPQLPVDSASEDLEQFTDWLRGLRR